MKGKRLLIVGAAVALAISGCASAVQTIRKNPFRANLVEVKDVITAGDLAATNTTYTNFSGVTITSDAVYAGNSAKDSSGNVQLRSKNSNSGIVSTASGGIVKSVKITVGSGTNTIDVYGSNTAYSSAADLYATGGNSNQGTKVGSVSATGTVTFNDEYEYVGIRSNNGALYLSSIEITWLAESNPDSSSSSSESSESSSSESSSSSSSEPTAISATFAEALAVGQNLASGSTTTDYYKFQGYVRAKDGNNYYLTATAEETYDPSNAIELFKAGLVSGLPEKLLKDAKVEVTMLLKNYNGTVENGNTLVSSDVTVIVVGTEWSTAITEVSVTEALAIINALGDGVTTSELYAVQGFIVSIQYTWSSNNGITFVLGSSEDSTDGISVFKSNIGNDAGCSSLQPLDEVKVTGNLQKYVKNGETTPELKNGSTELVQAGPNHPVDVNVYEVATVKTIAEVNAYANADNTLIAKVSGVTDSIENNQFYLIDPSTGDSVLVYHGYTDATFQKAGNAYSTKTKSTYVTNSIIGNAITVYSVISSYNGAIQLKDALVVDSGEKALVNASVSVNDNDMGTATLSKTSSIAYGSEVVVAPAPAAGYRVKSVSVERISGSDTLSAESDGTYKFNAKSKNVVVVTFEAAPAVVEDAVVVSLAKYEIENIKNTNTAVSNGAAIKDWFKKVSGEDILSSVNDGAVKVYAGANGGNGDTAWDTDNALKIGTASAGGSVTLNLTKNVVKVVITGYAWKESLSLSVGSAVINPALADNIANKANVTSGNAGKATAVIDSSNEITISTGSTSVVIIAIEFFGEVPVGDAINNTQTRSSLSYSYIVDDDPVTYEFKNVAIRFGGFISEEFWSTLNGKSEIQGYGVKLLAAPGEAEPIDFYYPLSESKLHPAEANASQKAQQGVDAADTYYVWNLYVNVFDNLTYEYSAVAYIKTEDGYVYFATTTASAADLADQLIDSGFYASDAFDGSLSYLASLN